jgi:hypothetical protein
MSMEWWAIVALVLTCMGQMVVIVKLQGRLAAWERWYTGRQLQLRDYVEHVIDAGRVP